MSERLSWTQPICERCWIEQETTFVDADRVEIRSPIQATERQVEICAWCEYPTIMGIYKRADPTTVRRPAMRDD